MPLVRKAVPLLNQRATRSRGHWTGVLTMFIIVGSNGRLLAPERECARGRRLATKDPKNEQLERLRAPSLHRRLVPHVQQLVSRLRRRRVEHKADQPAFSGTWKFDRAEGFDTFLKHMGVGPLKRSIAARASQQQVLRLVGQVISLEIADPRGKASYDIVPDGEVRMNKGFMKLPVHQRATWGRDGALLVEELYSQHLGGPDHGKACSGVRCPLVRSRRSVDLAGQMVVELEREGLKMWTWYTLIGQAG